MSDKVPNKMEKKTYNECIKKASKKVSKNDLSLCPRGYCTAKEKYKVYPSAYANGFAVQVCKGDEPDVKGVSKEDKSYMKRLGELKGKKQEGGGEKKKKNDLKRWFDEKWVNVCEKNKKGEFKPCGRSVATLKAKEYPYCRPLHKLKGTPVVTAKELTEKEIETMCKKKKSIEPGVDGKPTRVLLEKETQRGKERKGKNKT